MAWIESHQDLEEHPKILLLCNKAGWNLDEAIGKLHRLWWWALKYAEDGDLSKFEPSQFLVRLNGKISPQELYKTLKEAGFVDKNDLIHDWLDYAGRYLTSKYRTSNPNRLRMIYKKHKAVFSLPKDPLKSDRLPTYLDNLTNLYTHLENPVFKDGFIKYLEMRQKIRKPATEHAIELVLKELQKYPLETATKMLEQSIMNSWQGIFPLRKENKIQDDPFKLKRPM
jgi:hypothetical protein